MLNNPIDILAAVKRTAIPKPHDLGFCFFPLRGSAPALTDCASLLIMRQQNISDVLTFDRPMDHASVEKNLVIDPPLPGKLSWAGRRLAYTLTSPIPYGECAESI